MPNTVFRSVLQRSSEVRPSTSGRKASLVTAREVADALQVSTHCIYRAAKCLGMPSHRLGRYVRFDLDEVLDWVCSGGADIREEAR